MSIENKHPKTRLLELDVLRGLACFFVVLFHLTMSNPKVNQYFKYGITGVDLFFMISGFVIFLTLEKTKSWKDFVVSRISRLYPGYWTCVSITALLIIVNGKIQASSSFQFLLEYLANMTMFQHYLGVFDLDGPYWTLITEMVFYAYMLFIFQFIGMRHLEKTCIITLICVLFYSTILSSFPKIHHLIRAAVPLVNHFPLFFSGILFYQIKMNATNGSWWRWLLILVCLLIQMSLLEDGKRVVLYLQQAEYNFILLFYFTIFSLYALDFLKFIVNPVFLFLGKISYAIYLIHQYLSVEILTPYLTNELKISFWFSILICLIASVILATIITYYIEKPALKYIRDLYLKKKEASKMPPVSI